MTAAKKTITSSEFTKSIGVFMEKSAKEPVFITKHKRPARVLMDIDEYNRLKSNDTRTVHQSSEMPDEHVKMLEQAEYGDIDPELEKLME